ncbi:MAG: FAD-dependent oxidoreductase [Methyloceanibacter sp.]|nr:FAD-dependent oxidoreductase [Methyloceanibacter sp.]
MLLAIGAQEETDANWPGAEMTLSATDLLHRVAVHERPRIGEVAVVLGDGIEAVDAARTLTRLGTGTVVLMCESDPRSDASLREHLEAAQAEGVTLEQPAQPVSLKRAAHDHLLLEWQRGDTRLQTIASCVVRACERRVSANETAKLGVPCTARGIAVDRATLATSLAGVFAAGDAVSGPASTIRAIAAGRQAALSIHQYRTCMAAPESVKSVNVIMSKLDEEERAAFHRGFPKVARARQSPIATGQQSGGFAETLAGLTSDDARREAQRCLHCDCLAKEDCKLRLYATEYGADPRKLKGERRRFQRDETHGKIVYESGKCILCGLCVRIAEQAGERLGIGFVNRGFATQMAVPFGATMAAGLPSAAERCARACPTGALSFKRGPARDESGRTGSSNG